jgi:hypothetical protein
VCWSRKGKQIAVGTSDGSIIQVKLDGEIAATITGDGVEGLKVQELLWLENKLFLAFYTGHGEQEPVIRAISRDDKVLEFDLGTRS